jgi:hypothetical protein
MAAPGVLWIRVAVVLSVLMITSELHATQTWSYILMIWLRNQRKTLEFQIPAELQLRIRKVGLVAFGFGT